MLNPAWVTHLLRLAYRLVRLECMLHMKTAPVNLTGEKVAVKSWESLVYRSDCIPDWNWPSPYGNSQNNPNKPDCGKCASWKAVGTIHQKLRGDIYSLCINAIILNHIKFKRQTDKQMSGESNISKKQTQTDWHVERSIHPHTHTNMYNIRK